MVYLAKMTEFLRTEKNGTSLKIPESYVQFDLLCGLKGDVIRTSYMLSYHAPGVMDWPEVTLPVNPIIFILIKLKFGETKKIKQRQIKEIKGSLIQSNILHYI